MSEISAMKYVVLIELLTKYEITLNKTDGIHIAKVAHKESKVVTKASSDNDFVALSSAVKLNEDERLRNNTWK